MIGIAALSVVVIGAAVGIVLFRSWSAERAAQQAALEAKLAADEQAFDELSASAAFLYVEPTNRTK